MATLSKASEVKTSFILMKEGGYVLFTECKDIMFAIQWVINENIHDVESVNISCCKNMPSVSFKDGSTIVVKQGDWDLVYLHEQ